MAATYRAVVDDEGRIVIPEELRRRLGLRAGSPVDVSDADGMLVLGDHGIAAETLNAGDSGSETAPLRRVESRAGNQNPISDQERVHRSRRSIRSSREMSEDLDDEIEEAMADGLIDTYRWIGPA